MKQIIYISLIVFLQLGFVIQAQVKKTDANIIGHVVHNGEHIKFANLIIVGTTIGTATDETGHYRLMNLSVGKIKLRAQALGYKPKEESVLLEEDKTIEIKFELEKDVLGMEQVVVTSDRNKVNRNEASTIVNILTPKMFENTQSSTFCDALNYTPGVRTENNCENCGFTQVRMNGMEGPYSQILINSRPIFSGLAGVYGLELIPTNMIEKVEVVRGGGSALYGSNAIAGTINLILKDPIKNSYEVGSSSGMVGVGVNGSGNAAFDNSISFNASLISSDSETGLAVFGFHRNRDEFDANNDSYSEISLLENSTIGGRLFHRFSDKDKLSLDFFNIHEDRRGGDKFENPVHEANIAEAVTHNITTAAANYEQFFRKQDLLSIFASGQYIDRDSYYGAEKSLSDYGNTKDFSYSFGAQYNAEFNNSKLIFGVENNGSWMEDLKLGYPDFDNAIVEDGKIVEIPHTENVVIADQQINTFGGFTQYEIKMNKFKISLGGRFDYYQVKDLQKNGSEKSGNVFSPRINLLYDIQDYLQFRINYSQGYRAPQIFDEDLHIETSGSRQVIHVNDPNLTQETSYSLMASLDFNKQIESTYLSFLVEGFFTKLDNPFVNEFGEPDESGRVVYTRVNAENGAIVQGGNFELNIVPSSEFNIQSGFTIQTSEFEEIHEFDEKRFFRTPNNYGYLSFNWDPSKIFGISASANYTGEMLAAYFGPEIQYPEEGELRETDSFIDLGLKLKYNYILNGASIQLYGGIKNILNSYQNDFDKGIGRDPGYIYGPMNPRTIYLGLRIGNDI